MSHTPGPWAYLPPDDELDDGVVRASDGTYVAQTSYDSLSYTKAHDELADGRLIAAAPDMLAALMAFRFCGGIAPDYTATCIDVAYEPVCDHCQAAIAIAKATGTEVSA